MKFVFASYISTRGFTDPGAWIERIGIYTGMLEALAKKNDVTSIEQIAYEGKYEKAGVNYIFKQYSRAGLLFPIRLNKFILAQNPEVVVIQSFQFPLQVIQLRLLAGKKIKIIVQNHAERPMKGLKKYAQRLADRCIDAYLFASHELGAEWVVNGNISSATKIYEVMEVSSVFLPTNKDLARKRTGASGEPIFLWVGRLNANKDPITVVKAFLRFAKVKSSARLYMLYHTEELLEQLKDLLDTSPQKDNVVLVGRLPHCELQDWFNSADVILSGSHYEGSGTAVCEAMSCGCMPVVTDIASFRMITNRGKCGLLYEPGNEEALLSVLKKTTEIDLDEKQKLSLDHFKTTLSFGAIASKIHQIAASL
ncbi:glycosyltransferase family 4 protein [Mucilaginibacter sp.]|jgi:glycosyltransferase involved in cell wall biosynthesis|uniref:glycosyltransferase family 4 protein n=1 Tax=Mucilaginibacter sp. TaxID=1882438 RepID=UPI002BD0ABCA|nr:glycosyltransferase family 4 protein [Mucilaginibacter sp.]HTI58371.1 glycosyltransferase family 4 protein [Mucilaginibacter sp.]